MEDFASASLDTSCSFSCCSSFCTQRVNNVKHRGSVHVYLQLMQHCRGLSARQTPAANFSQHSIQLARLMLVVTTQFSMQVASLTCAASAASFSSCHTCSCARLNIALQSPAPQSDHLIRCCVDARRRFAQQLLQPVLLLHSSDRNLFMLQDLQVA